MSRSAALCATLFSISGLFAVRAPGADAHVYLMEPTSRNFYYTAAFQNWDFEDITYCPHCYQSRGPAAVRARAEANTPSETLRRYGGGAWPHKTAYERGELASNGNYLEDDEISVRHGICGDPEQTAAEGSNVFGKENSVYPVLETYQEGSVIEMKVIVSTYHWGHLEYFICNSEDLSDGEDGPVTQGCFNMHPLNRAKDDGAASPIDPNHPGRYHLDPPCREAETNQEKADGAFAGYVVTGRYQLPEDLTCDRCIVQMVYYTGNACRQPGYDDFNPESVPDGCVPSASDWITLDPPPCGDGLAYPEEFWNCADISIVSEGSTSSSSTTETQPTPAPISDPVSNSEEPTPAPTIDPVSSSENATPSPVAEDDKYDGDGKDDGGDSNGDDVDGDGNDECSDPVGGWGQCGGESWTGSACCRPGYMCYKLVDSYHQCRPIEDSCSFHWEQCGGIGWEGASCCSAGSESVARNEWFSQCVPTRRY